MHIIGLSLCQSAQLESANLLGQTFAACTQQFDVYLMETKAVHSLALTTLFYLTLILPTILVEIRCADSKHVVWAEVATNTSISKLLKFSVPITLGIDSDN